MREQSRRTRRPPRDVLNFRDITGYAGHLIAITPTLSWRKRIIGTTTA